MDAQGVFDDGLLVLGRGPATYTGEDAAELTCHGNPLVVERLVEALVQAGARLALPGEFTRRALVHGKLDLLGAEAIHQLSVATSRQGLEVARQGLDGRLAAFSAELRQELLTLAAELEAALDHPEEDLTLLSEEQIAQRCLQAASRLRDTGRTWSAGRAWVEGARVALVGEVNAGKSSLLNALLGRARALVHPEPGTTRDVLEVPLRLGGLSLTLLDTAGERQTEDPVEAAGLALARELVAEADLLVVVARARSQGLSPTTQQVLERVEDGPHLRVYNGVDLSEVAPAPPGWLPTSARTGQGLDELRQALVRALVGAEPRAHTLVVASQRQRDALVAAGRWAQEAAHALPAAGPAVAADALARALSALDELTGAETREDVLSALFSRFCIGK